MQEDFQSEKEVEGTRGWQMLQTAHILKQKGVCLCVCERGREGGLGVKILSSEKASQSVCCEGKQQHSEGFQLGESLKKVSV